MKNKLIRKRIIWRNFFKLMGVGFVFILLSVSFIYNRSLSVVQEQFLKINEQRTSIATDNTLSVLRQMNKVLASLCVDEDTFLFFEAESPELIDEGLYNRVRSKLKTYSFGMDYISSIVLYSPTYNRMIDHDSSDVVSIATAISKSEYDADWLQYLVELNEGGNLLTKIRSVNENYPHVMTLIRQYQTNRLNAVVAMNLELKALYPIIWPENNDNTQIFVLDEEGRVIIGKEKQGLYENRDTYPVLKLFSYTQEPLSIFVKEALPYTYSQQYNEEYGLYFVSVSYLEGYYEQIYAEQKEIFLIFICSVMVIGGLVLLYSTSSFRPFQSILEVLENPNSWKEKETPSESQVYEIVEQIVYHLQVNNDLRIELDKRLGLLRETQVQALQAQLNPHFLFNSLDAIDMMLEEKGEDKIAKLVEYLMDILRHSLSDKEMVDIKTEIEYLRKYVYIMECRYGYSFEVVFDIDENIFSYMVPRLILQPLIENAVFHGISPMKRKNDSLLSIHGRAILYRFEGSESDCDAIQIDVEDNGYGMTEEKREQLLADMKDLEHIDANHIGLQNVAKRLYLLFPNKARVEIQSKRNQGTCISLIFPKI